MPPTPLRYPALPPVPGLRALEPPAAAELAERLPVTPQYVIPYAGLHRGRDRVFVEGAPEDPDVVVDEHWGTPGELEVWGRHPEAAWKILSRIPGWFCVNGSAEAIARLRPVLEQELRLPYRELGDLFYILEKPPVGAPEVPARRLTLADLRRVDEYEPPVWGNSYATVEELLGTGIVAGVIEDERLVAVAVESARNRRYADIGVHTRSEWRGRGYSTAAAATVASELQARGLTPIWSTSSTNRASQRVAEKVGFRPGEAGAYLVFDDLRTRGGYRPA